MDGKTIKCRAAVIWEANQPFVIEEIEVSPPRRGEVRFKVIASGVCHSDINSMTGKLYWGTFPAILGHEGAGIVESVGEGVTTVKPGDHILATFLALCGKCRLCKNPDVNFCEWTVNGKYVMSDGRSRFTCKGQEIFHFGPSSFSEYSVVREFSVVKINKAAPLDKVCLISCAIPTGYGSVINTAKVNRGSTCAVWGLGCIGLSAVMGCKVAGASRIIGVDINPTKFDKAKEFGCTDCVNPNDYDKPIQQVLKEMTESGLDYTFECIGLPETMRAAFESCCDGSGTCIIIGVGFNDVTIPINPLLLLFRRTLRGNLLGDFHLSDLPQLVEDYLQKKIKIDELITHNLRLDDINTAVELMKAGKCIRTVLKME